MVVLELESRSKLRKLEMAWRTKLIFLERSNLRKDLTLEMSGDKRVEFLGLC